MKRAPSYEKLFSIQNSRIADAIIADDATIALKQIEILERLMRVKKTLMDLKEKIKARKIQKPKIDEKIEKEKLWTELEARFERLAENNL